MRTYIRKKLEIQEIEDVQSLCRLCLGKTDEMTSIFDANVGEIFTGLPLKIIMCLGLEVTQDDALPKSICQHCSSELDKFYTFKKNCAATYRKLKAALFIAKKIVKNEDNDESSQKTTNVFISDSHEKSKESVMIESSQCLEENEMSTEITINKLSLEEQQRKENVILDENEKNNSKITSCQNQSLADVKPEQRYVNGNQLNEVKQIIDVLQAQEDEKKEKPDNMKSMECLPAYIVTALVEKGLLAQKDDTLEILDQNMKTFHLETACGNEISMELVEEEPETPVDGGNNSSRSNISELNLKRSARWCGTCGARFSSRGELVRHLRVHSGEKPFPCRTCGRRFAQREVLRRHELLHSDKLPYQCTLCPKAYTQRGALEAHARSHAPPAARPLVLHRCSRCPKVFLYPSGLSRHMSVHQGRDFPCDECPRTFNDRSSLQRHRRVHQRARAR